MGGGRTGIYGHGPVGVGQVDGGLVDIDIRHTADKELLVCRLSDPGREDVERRWSREGTRQVLVALVVHHTDRNILEEIRLKTNKSYFGCLLQLQSVPFPIVDRNRHETIVDGTRNVHRKAPPVQREGEQPLAEDIFSRCQVGLRQCGPESERQRIR